MSQVVTPWAGTPDERRTVESRLLGMVGRFLRRVNYLDPHTSGPWRIKAHPGFDGASMGVELHWEASDNELKWMTDGEREGVAVVFDQTPAEQATPPSGNPVRAPASSRPVAAEGTETPGPI